MDQAIVWQNRIAISKKPRLISEKAPYEKFNQNICQSLGAG